MPKTTTCFSAARHTTATTAAHLASACLLAVATQLAWAQPVPAMVGASKDARKDAIAAACAKLPPASVLPTGDVCPPTVLPGSASTAPTSATTLKRPGTTNPGADQSSTMPDRADSALSSPQANGQTTGQPSTQRQPEPPSDYQLFVEQATGKLLPIYGSELFSGGQFQALQGVQVPDTYVVGPGDELVLQAFGLIEFAERVTVGRDGQISIPKVGPVKVAGLKFSELQATLSRSMGQVFRNFTLQVSLGRLRSIEVFVLGQARTPGKKVVSSLSTLINALFETGGPSAKGSLRHIELRRNGKTVAKVDMYRFIAQGDSTGDVPLQSGDIIFVPPVGPQVGLVGSVNREAIYELAPGQDTVQAVLDLTGGMPTLAAPQKAQLDRIDPTRQPARYAEDLALDAKGLQTKLRAGDVLSVFQVSPQIGNTVTLQGNVATPMRYAYRKGMKVSDLMVDNTFLVPFRYWLSTNSGVNQRTNAVTDGPNAMDNNRLPSVDADRRKSPDTLRRTNIGADRPNSDGQTSGGYNVPQVNLDYATLQRLDPLTLRTELFAFNPSRALAGDAAEDLQLKPGDVVRIYGPDEEEADTLNTITIRGDIVGGTKRFAWRPGVGIKHIIPSTDWLVQRYNYWQRPKGDTLRADINWDYAQIIRRVPDTLQTRSVEFNLGAAIMGKAADVKLEPGDEITLFTTAQLPVPTAKRIRIVKLGGEVATPGAYQVQPGETLAQLISRAGGLTPQAYLYGAEFSRESVKAVQQKNLDKIIAELDGQVASSSAELAANVGGRSAESAQLALAAQQNIRTQQLAKLRGVRSNGRVALELPTGSLNVADLPPIQLEDGDSFTVPNQPSFVSAFGAVHNENVFVFRPGRTVQDVLAIAGPTQDAELDEVFVVRADGTVVNPRSGGWTRRTLMGGTVASTELMPGDSVVVPTKVDRETTWSFITRQFKDWTQILGNLGLGVAAFKSL